MSAPGDALTAAMLRHQASMDAARATAERIAAERAANNKEVAPLFTVPSGGATSNNNGG